MVLVETFVAPEHEGASFRASNWVSLGRTRGFSREPGGTTRWREHRRAKEVYVYVYAIEKDAGAALRRGCTSHL